MARPLASDRSIANASPVRVNACQANNAAGAAGRIIIRLNVVEYDDELGKSASIHFLVILDSYMSRRWNGGHGQKHRIINTVIYRLKNLGERTMLVYEVDA